MQETKKNKVAAAKAVLASVKGLEDALERLASSLDESDFIADQSEDESKGLNIGPGETKVAEEEDEDIDFTETDEEEGEESEPIVASCTDPNGVEEEITQEYLHDVGDLRKSPGEQPQDANLVQDVAPTRFELSRKYASEQLRTAAACLDKAAEYFENAGKVKTAMAIDMTAEAIEGKASELEEEA